VLASGTRGERAFFDADAVRKKRAGDMTLSDLGRDAKMPWQIDGRKWHLVDRVAYNGKPCRWEGTALERIIDFLESAPSASEIPIGHIRPIRPISPIAKAAEVVDETSGATGGIISSRKSARIAELSKKLSGKITTGALLEQRQQKLPGKRLGVVDPDARLTTNWNERSVVEVIGPDVSRGWFLHALTGDEWLLTLKFRVPENTFQQKSLAASLKLKSVDEIREIEAYGRADRVRVKESDGPWQEVTITVHWLREIDTPAFWEFLNTAKYTYLAKTGRRRIVPR